MGRLDGKVSLITAAAQGIGVIQGLSSDSVFGKAVNNGVLSVGASASAVAAYDDLSDAYQSGKTGNNIPLN